MSEAAALALQRLLEIMRRLRDPAAGCPWDREQDFASIAPYTIEEAYEVADAITRDAPADIESEFGDLLFQVVFHAQLGQEREWFDFASVAHAISDKLTARHPHVFAEVKAGTEREQNRAWEEHKAHERAARRASRRRVSWPMCRWRCRHWRAPRSSANAPGAWASIGRMRRACAPRSTKSCARWARRPRRNAARRSATCCLPSPTGRVISGSIRKRRCGARTASSSGAFAPWSSWRASAALRLEQLDAATWDALWNEVKNREKVRENDVQ